MKVKHTYEWYNFYSENNPAKTEIQMYEDWTYEKWLNLVTEQIKNDVVDGNVVTVYIDNKTGLRTIEQIFDYGEHVHLYQIIEE